MLAGVAAMTFGVADFLGGSAARRVPSVVVAVLAQVAGLILLLTVLFALPSALVPAALLWGALAGAAGGAGIPLLYRALAAGPMNVVAPLVALTSSVLPVLVGTLLGERPSATAWAGIALAVVAGVVVGMTAPEPVSERSTRGALAGITLALVSGVCFGGFYTLVAQAPAEGGLWPVTVARMTGTVLAVLVLLAALRGGGLTVGALRPNAGAWRLAAACGALDAAANALYLLAVQQGQLAVMGALMGMYPASTVLLARWLDGEKIAPLQRVGLVLAIPALLMVGAG
ncbi:DMT family transporter [Pseudonocardia eucalypti]|uniref:DMT family transporter n=1 Tax=Pseudonocardia eucalypti TaxID=648755 RepID=A0ABP9PHV4_9PSEU